MKHSFLDIPVDQPGLYNLSTDVKLSRCAGPYHLGGPIEGKSSDIRGDIVDKHCGLSNEARVSIKQALVIDLQVIQHIISAYPNQL